jgi:hypothetical protein
MYKPYSTPIAEACPNIKIPLPRISGPIIFLIQLPGRIYLFIFPGIAGVALRGAIFIAPLNGRSGGQDRRAAIQSAMEDPGKAYLDCIEEANKGG